MTTLILMMIIMMCKWGMETKQVQSKQHINDTQDMFYKTALGGTRTHDTLQSSNKCVVLSVNLVLITSYTAAP
jgi:hypothetical protein